MSEGQNTPNRIAIEVDHLLLLEHVRSIVSEAAQIGGTLRIGPHAKRLSESYGSSGISQKNISDELLIVAAQAGVPVEIDCSP